MRNVAVVDKVIVIPQHYKATEKHSLGQAEKSPVAAKPATTREVTTVKKVKAKTIRAVAKKRSTIKPHLRVANKQLLKINKKFYTLQLLGTHSEQAAREFIKAKKIAAHGSYFKVELNGKPWFVLVYGRYETRTQALRAIKALPSSLKGLKPWPRSFVNIHSAINKVRVARKTSKVS